MVHSKQSNLHNQQQGLFVLPKHDGPVEKYPSQLEKGGVPTPGHGGDPARRGGVQIPGGLVHE